MDTNLVEAAVRKAMFREFTWGSDDCCTFACDIIREVTGRDLMAKLRGTYHDEAGAYDAMGGCLVATALHIAQEQRLEKIDYPFENAALGVVASPVGPMLAIYIKGRFVVRSTKGISYLPASAGVLAWSVE